MQPTELKFTIAAAGALLLVGCDQPAQPQWTAQQDTTICVDQSGNRAPDDQCQRTEHHGGGVSPFLWYYLGRQVAIPYYGERVTGGGFTRTAGATYFHAPVTTAMTRSAAIARGGFGATSHAMGGFGE